MGQMFIKMSPMKNMIMVYIVPFNPHKPMRKENGKPLLIKFGNDTLKLSCKSPLKGRETTKSNKLWR